MQVVNISSFSSISAAKKAGIIYCGRPSLLGNPCSRPGVACPICRRTHFGPRMKQLDESRGIECYRKWLWGKIKLHDGDVLTALGELKEDDRLGCYCYPLSCHCDVIIKAWHWLNSQGRI